MYSNYSLTFGLKAFPSFLESMEEIVVVPMLLVACSVLLFSVLKARLKTQNKSSIRSDKPKIKLLSEDEYKGQALEGTKRALEDLKNYCRDSSSTEWKFTLRNPKKFERFVHGSSHVTEAEVLEHRLWDWETDDGSTDSDTETLDGVLDN